MASADESANSGATHRDAAGAAHVLRAPDQLRPPLWRRAMDALTLIPPAYADSCLPVTYSACSAGVRTATFNGCTVGAVAVDGSVNLTFSDSGGLQRRHRGRQREPHRQPDAARRWAARWPSPRRAAGRR